MRFSMNLQRSVNVICMLWICLHQVESEVLISQLETIQATSEKLIASLVNQLQELSRHANHSNSNSFNENRNYATSCLTSLFNAKGVRRIKVPGLQPFEVSCDNCIAGFGWLVIQRRTNGSVNFYRNWQEYKKGFGDLNGEFFIGLEKLRAITALEPFELYIALEDFDGKRRYAKFDEFAIGAEEDDFALNVLGVYSGNAGDSLRSHRKMKFSTYDRDNDKEFRRNCAFMHVGAWWYNSCVDSNLNGQYIAGGEYEEKLFARGMCWRAWRGHNYGYKFTQMMIRPKCRNIPEALRRHSNSSAETCESFEDPS